MYNDTRDNIIENRYESFKGGGVGLGALVWGETLKRAIDLPVEADHLITLGEVLPFVYSGVRYLMYRASLDRGHQEDRARLNGPRPI